MRRVIIIVLKTMDKLVLAWTYGTKPRRSPKTSTSLCADIVLNSYHKHTVFRMNHPLPPPRPPIGTVLPIHNVYRRNNARVAHRVVRSYSEFSVSIRVWTDVRFVRSRRRFFAEPERDKSRFSHA